MASEQLLPEKFQLVQRYDRTHEGMPEDFGLIHSSNPSSLSQSHPLSPTLFLPLSTKGESQSVSLPLPAGLENDIFVNTPSRPLKLSHAGIVTNRLGVRVREVEYLS